ncbi:MAG: diacylglycerol kinase [Oscillospiraceae bacterium]|nr:diacylglycerol kinase [Oscillospiraceae bacterium]
MQPKREIKSLVKSFKNAFCGLSRVVRNERNFRIHSCFMVYVIFFSLVGHISSSVFARFLICFGMVMSAELINTALELLCDAMSDKFDRRIRDIKDISAAAVLVAAVFSAAVGLFVFLSPSVFSEIVSRFFEKPWLFAAFLISLPFAVLFIVGGRKK